MLKILSEIILYVFSFGVSNIIMSTLNEKIYQYIYLIVIGIVGIVLYLKTHDMSTSERVVV
tara:strand:+ start:516 stop:698 length:183 start_codon:yes stop_codon:yes gene_type:complete